MDKKKCETWNNFEVVDGEKAKCNFCSNTISYKGGGSMANLTRHLKRKHIVQYKARKKRSIEILEKNIDEPDNVSISEPSHFNLTTITPITKNKTANVTKTQVSIDAYTSRPMPISKSKTIDEQLGIMMAQVYQPFSLVENKGFKIFLSLLNPSYSLPSRKTITYNI